MEEKFFKVHAALEQNHWWFVARTAIIRHVVATLLSKDDDGMIIDVGCGTGGMTAALAQDYACLGIDRSEIAIETARKAFPNVPYRLGQAPDALADIRDQIRMIILGDVLEHIEDDKRFLASLVEFVAPGTQFIITVPANPQLWSRHDETAHHFRRYHPETLSDLWRSLPVKVKVLTPFNAYLYPLIWIARFVGNRLERTFGSSGTDFALPPKPLNKLLTRVFESEHARIIELIENASARPYRRGVSLFAILEKTGG